MEVGNYTLLHMLGRGGTSEVYAAKHRARGGTVAVKLMRTPGVEDLLAEATRVRDIRHPNVVRMLEVGQDGETCYLVMDLIEGETLAERIVRTQRIEESELRELGAAIADGMQAAHARGIVHRDLKPGNVMLHGDVPIIVDFGIAKSLGSAAAAVTERRVGTVAYMAPEQLVDGLITPAVDIWALGVTLYEAATGQLPFTSFQDGRLPQLFEAAPRIQATSPAFADLVARCLDRDPGKRPATMADIARVLRSDDGDRVTADIGSISPRAPRIDGGDHVTAATGSGVSAPVRSSVSRSPVAKKRWPLLLVGGAGLAAIATALIVTRAPATPTAAPATMTTPTASAPIDAAVTAPIVEPPVIEPPVNAAPTVTSRVDKSPVVKSPAVTSRADKSPVVQAPRPRTKRTKPPAKRHY